MYAFPTMETVFLNSTYYIYSDTKEEKTTLLSFILKYFIVIQKYLGESGHRHNFFLINNAIQYFDLHLS